MPLAKPTEVVNLSYRVFALWWLLILAVHTATCFYNAIYAYYYWILQDTYMNTILDSFAIGMPPIYHHTISIVHGIMSVMHAVCIALMLGGTAKQCSLAFTPWRSSDADAESEKSLTDRTSSKIVQSFTRVYSKVSDRHGFFGINGKYFREIHAHRQIVERSLQTVQAYRMSMLLPRTLLNRFYVVLLAVNCWSTAIVNTGFFKGDEARRRLASTALDCALDLMAYTGVEVIVVLSYAVYFDLSLDVYSYIIWYDNQWMARAANEFQMVVVVSWFDLLSRAVFSLGLLMTTTNMKQLLRRLPQHRNSVVQADLWAVPCKPAIIKQSVESQTSTITSTPDAKLSTRVKHVILHIAHVSFWVWGVAVLGLHIHASMQSLLPQCLMQVQPWAATKPSCYLAGLDCSTLGISGKLDEVDAMWSVFDSSTVVQLLIRHCPELEVPPRFTKFHHLRGIKVYNTTIKEWNNSAAITDTNHPEMSNLYIVRVNMTNGLLPTGFQSTDFPQILYEIDFCVTNLRELPADLDEKWLAGSNILLEYSQLTVVPSVALRLQPTYLALTGNPITHLPPELFEVDSMYLLGISNMNLHELPRNVTKLSENLMWVFLRDTNISFFWAWADELVARMESVSAPWIAGSSTYCIDLAEIQNGTANGFQVPLSPEYSQTLMDASEENLQKISKAANCKAKTNLPSGEGLFHPLDYEDSINSVSISI